MHFPGRRAGEQHGSGLFQAPKHCGGAVACGEPSGASQHKAYLEPTHVPPGLVHGHNLSATCVA